MIEQTNVTKNHEFSSPTLEEIRAVVASISPDANASYEGAMKLAMRGDIEGATANMHRALALDPKMVKAWLELADWAEHSDQSDLAAHYCERVLEVDPDNPDALAGLAVALHNQDRNTAALEVLERFNRLHNSDGRRRPETCKLQVELMTLIGSASGIDFTKRIIGSDPQPPISTDGSAVSTSAGTTGGGGKVSGESGSAVVNELRDGQTRNERPRRDVVSFLRFMGEDVPILAPLLERFPDLTYGDLSVFFADNEVGYARDAFPSLAAYDRIAAKQAERRISASQAADDLESAVIHEGTPRPDPLDRPAPKGRSISVEDLCPVQLEYFRCTFPTLWDLIQAQNGVSFEEMTDAQIGAALREWAERTGLGMIDLAEVQQNSTTRGSPRASDG